LRIISIFHHSLLSRYPHPFPPQSYASGSGFLFFLLSFSCRDLTPPLFRLWTFRFRFGDSSPLAKEPWDDCWVFLPSMYSLCCPAFAPTPASLPLWTSPKADILRLFFPCAPPPGCSDRCPTFLFLRNHFSVKRRAEPLGEKVLCSLPFDFFFPPLCTPCWHSPR